MLHGLDDYHDDTEGVVFRDVIMLALAGFVALVILLLPHIAEPGARQTEDVPAPGNVIVEIRWPDALDADVDLWVQAPGDVPVGYSNKGGLIFNLLRDDLGLRADATRINYEVTYSRGIPPGEYTVNLHLYRNKAGVIPVPVTVVVSVKGDPTQSGKQILASDVDLTRNGQELTVFRFALDEDGSLRPGSVHSLAKPLRSASS